MSFIPIQRSLRQLGGRQAWLPIGFRGRGLPGSGGNADLTNNSLTDFTIWQAPSFSAVRAIKLVYSGFDLSNFGPIDRGQIVTGYASAFLPGANSFVAYPAATVASGATSFNLYCSSALQSNAVSQGMAISGTGIATGTYVVSVSPTYASASGTLSSYMITLSQATTAALSGPSPGPATALSISGSLFPTRWGGRRQASIEPMHDMLVSDEVPLLLSPNQLFGIRGSWTFGNAINSVADYPAPTSGSTRLTLGGITESCNRGMNLPDLSLSPYQPANSGGGFWPPVAILGLLADAKPRPAVLIVGDSIAAGTGDLADSSGRMGYIQRSLGNAIPWASVARGSTTATQAAAATRGLYRLAEEANCTDVLLEYCRNDINAGVAALGSFSVKTMVASVAAPFITAGMRVWVFTCPPTTNSTDSWTTAANQSIPSPSYETQRVAYNNDVRANWASYGYAGLIDIASVVEDVQNPGKWQTSGGPWTTDGVHPNATNGHPALISAGLVSLNMFTL